MPSDAKPSVVLVHGSWHSNECWERVIPLFKAQGYPCVPVGLPTVDNAPIANTWDDADKIREAVEELVNQEKEVIVVLHSAAGSPGCSGVAGLGLSERQGDGKKGGVIKIVCIAAILFPEDGVGPPNEKLMNGKQVWTMSSTGDSIMANNPEFLFYNDLSEEDAKYWASKLRWTSFPPKLPKRAGWRTIPMSYLVCEDDNAIPYETQISMIDDIKKYGAKQVDVTTISGSHSPFLSQPETFVDFVINAAKA